MELIRTCISDGLGNAAVFDTAQFMLHYIALPVLHVFLADCTDVENSQVL